MKFFLAGLDAPTNVFIEIPTTTEDFKITSLIYGSNERSSPFDPQGILSVLWNMAREHGWEFVDGLYAKAEIGGPTRKLTYEHLRDAILADLKEAMPVDFVFLVLHGGMTAEDYTDCDGDLLKHIRRIVGANTPIGVLLDSQPNLTKTMQENADLFVALKLFPWNNPSIVDRSLELLNLLLATVEGKIKSVLSVFDCRMICVLRPDKQPLLDFINRTRSLEGKEGVLSISILGGNIYADNSEMGVKILVITDDRKVYGDQLAEQLGLELFKMRNDIQHNYSSVDEALQVVQSEHNMPLLLDDTGDSVIAGAPGDATFLLEAMLESKIHNVAVHNIWDPVSVYFANRAGEGAWLDLRIGGKTGPLSGKPVVCHARVNRVLPGFKVRIENYQYDFGDTVVVQVDGIEVVLSSKPSSVFHEECFTAAGINPFQRDALVVKSSLEFHPVKSMIFPEIIEVATPGASTWNPRFLPYKHINPNCWPFVEDPFGRDLAV
jgi:microcystin degradation protein MlrC